MKISTFSNVAGLWQTTLQELLRLPITGSRVGPVQRMVGATMRLSDPTAVILMNPERKFSIRYATAEFAWYLNPHAEIAQIEHYCPGYGKYANDNYGVYGRRVVGGPYGNQLVRVAKALAASQYDRRTVVAIWRAQDVFEGEKLDVPCNVSWKFYVEDKKLCLIADMRSNDAWLGMPNDIYANCCIQMLMAKMLGLELGFYQHQVGDLHLYSSNAKKAERAIAAGIRSITVPFNSAKLEWPDIRHFLDCEKELRLTGSRALQQPIDTLLSWFMEVL